jgi:nucleoside-diphosphate-sugar epimerase
VLTASRRVLVTGAGGFIGRHAVPHLLGRGFEVHALGRGQRPEHLPPEAFWHTADLLEPATASEIVTAVRPSHLLHLAWYATHGLFWTSAENLKWVEASLRLFRSFTEAGGQRAVCAGSCAEYDWDFGFCSEATTPRRPTSLYGICKNALREVLAQYCADAGPSIAWGRVFFLYGPGEKSTRLVPSVILSLSEGRRATFGPGRHFRDFLHVDDVASGLVALLDSSYRGALNIASGMPLQIRTVVETIARQMKRPDLVAFDEMLPPRPEPPLLVADTRQLEGSLGWKPRLGLEEGLAETIAHLRKHGAPECATLVSRP